MSNKLKYRPSPLNLVGTFFIGFAIWMIIDPGPEGWGILLVVPSAFIGFLLFFVDFFLQLYSKKYIEQFVIGMAIIGFLTLLYFIFWD